MSISLFRKPLSGQRYGAGTWTNGRWIEGAPTAIAFDASVQPTTAHELLTLDIARRERQSFTLYTDFKLVALTSGSKNPDVVFLNGGNYEVVQESPWQNNVISHYKFIVQKKDAIES